MRVLLIKTSSMGDIIHTLPALTDAGHAYPNGILFDWVIEESFAEIPAWHPLVQNVIPIELRKWRKGIFSKETRLAFRRLRERLHDYHYDLVLDAQGLVKSAFLTYFAKGRRAGLDFHSAREALASFAYQRKYKVNFKQHAILRMRQLFSLALNYPFPKTAPEFNIDKKYFAHASKQENYVVFLHSTTWASKQWPEQYWQKLADIAEANGFKIKISGGNQEELARAERIAKHQKAVQFMGRLTIAEMAGLLAHAKAAVAVDTGFGHLSAALAVPTVSLYGATNADFTGALGDHSLHLNADFACAPCLNRTCKYKKPMLVTPACFAEMTPEKVWTSLQTIM